MEPKSKPKRKVELKYAGPTVRFRADFDLLADECEKLQKALHDLLRFYDTLSGHVGELGVGWTYADIKRLEEIRGMVKVGS